MASVHWKYSIQMPICAEHIDKSIIFLVRSETTFLDLSLPVVQPQSLSILVNCQIANASCCIYGHHYDKSLFLFNLFKTI